MFLCFPAGFKAYIHPFKNYLTLVPNLILFPIPSSLIVFFFFLGIHILGNMSTVISWIVELISRVWADSSSLHRAGRNTCWGAALRTSSAARMLVIIVAWRALPSWQFIVAAVLWGRFYYKSKFDSWENQGTEVPRVHITNLTNSFENLFSFGVPVVA